MNPLVIYHADCADGFGAAFAAWLKFGDEAEYVPMKYGEDSLIEASVVGGRDVYILDFSFDKNTMLWLFDNANKVVWLDHHKTAFEMWGIMPNSPLAKSYTENSYCADITLDNNKSGAMLAWEYFHPDKDVPLLIKHIDDRDRWQFKLRGTKEFNAALFSYQPWSFEQWGELFVYDELYGQMITEGAAILRDNNQKVQTVVKNAKNCRIQFDWKPVVGTVGYKEKLGLAVNCQAFLASDVGHELATKSGTFDLCWYMDAQNVVKCSLRSNGDYDVSTIAKAFGGGGHRNAAGFQTDIQTLIGWLK